MIDGRPAAGPARREARGDHLMAAESCSSCRRVSKAFGGLQRRHRARPARRRGRDRQRDRARTAPARRRSSTSSPASTDPTRATSCFDGREHHRPRAAPDHAARRRAHVPDAAPVPQHDGAGERHGGRLRPHERGRRSARSCGRPGSGARSSEIRAARRGAARVLRPAADGLPLGPARVLASRTRTGAGSRSRARRRRSRGCSCSTSRPPG